MIVAHPMQIVAAGGLVEREDGQMEAGGSLPQALQQRYLLPRGEGRR